jgi:type I restriction enzyme R subunit
MSVLLDEIIANRKAKAIEYEEYLKRIAELAQKVEAGYVDSTPEVLKKSPAIRAIYNNLEHEDDKDRRGEAPLANVVYGDTNIDLAQKIHDTVMQNKPDSFRGVQAKEMVIKSALFKLLNDESMVERLFPIIKAQREY